MSLSPGRRYPGSNIRIDVLFKDDFGSLTDPTTVAFRTCDPCGSKTLYTYLTDAALQRVETGEYLIDFTPEKAGRWSYRWESTGLGVPFASEGTFVIQASRFYDSSDTGYAL